MKVTDKNNEKKRKIKKKPIEKSKKQQVVVVAQEIKFARLLSGNEKKTRDRVLRALKKWLVSCFEKNYEFKEDDFTRVWKGLFYAVWMSDKPLVQEDLCESIAGILDLFPTDQLSGAMLLAKAGFKMLATEWFGIDQHRLDKFLMLVRRYLRGALRCIHRCGWSQEACEQFADMLAGKDGILALKTPIYARNANSMVIHIAECYLEEISKVSSGSISPDSLCTMLRPFLAYLSLGPVTPLCIASRRLVNELLKFEEPEETDEDEIEKDSDNEQEKEFEENGDVDSEDETPSALDPRAGRVDTVLSHLPCARAQVAATLRSYLPRARHAGARRARTCLALLEQKPGEASRSEAPSEPEPPRGLRPSAAARALRALEKTLVADGDELALRGLSRKHRKRLLAKRRAGLSIVEDVQKASKKRPAIANGEWQVEDADKVGNKEKRKRSNKENEAEPKHKRQKLNKTSTETVSNLKNNVKKQKPNNMLKNSVKEIKSNIKVKHIKDKERTDVEDVKNVKEAKHSVKDNKEDRTNVKDVKNVKEAKHSVKDNKEDRSNVKDVKNVKEAKHSVKDVNVKVKSVKNDVKASKDKSKLNKEKSENEAKLVVNKVKKFQKQDKNSSLSLSTPKKVKFALKNNSMQGTLDYYKSIRESPNIPYDGSKRPTKTNLKPSTPSPINPFFKKKMTRRASFAAQIVY